MKSAAKLDAAETSGTPQGGSDAARIVTPISFGDSLLDHLVTSGRLDRSAMARVAAAMTRSGQAADIVLLELGLLGEQDLASIEARLLGLPLIRSADFPMEPVAVEAVSADFWRSAQLVPVAYDETAVTIATWENRPI